MTIECTGGACTGTAGNDVMRGTSIADTIDALGGDDRICGRGADDILYGGTEKEPDARALGPFCYPLGDGTPP